MDQARQEAANAIARDPNAKISFFAASAIYADTALRDQLLDGLRKAGLPD